MMASATASDATRRSEDFLEHTKLELFQDQCLLHAEGRLIALPEGPPRSTSPIRHTTR